MIARRLLLLCVLVVDYNHSTQFTFTRIIPSTMLATMRRETDQYYTNAATSAGPAAGANAPMADDSVVPASGMVGAYAIGGSHHSQAGLCGTLVPLSLPRNILY